VLVPLAAVPASLRAAPRLRDVRVDTPAASSSRTPGGSREALVGGAGPAAHRVRAGGAAAGLLALAVNELLARTFEQTTGAG
jgi:hypothetical protein